MRGVVVLAVAILVLSAFGQPDPPREWLVVRDTFPEFRGVPDSVVVANDFVMGVGDFLYSAGPSGFRSPLAEMGGPGWPMPVVLADTADSTVYFSRVDWTGQWEDPAPIADPCCPSYNVAASKVSQNVCITWVHSPLGLGRKQGFYRISTDGGVTWGPSTQLVWPYAYGGDTLTSFHSSSLFPFYDDEDGFHIAASVGPYLNDTNFILPAQIWHWKNGSWSFIHRAEPESLRAPVGYNSLVAGRPSLGSGPEDFDELTCVWEEFDGYNVDTATGLLRGDVWAAFSHDRGETWYWRQQLTGPGVPVSHRFPCICDISVYGIGPDSSFVMYHADRQAGFACLGQGSATQNPVVVCKFTYHGIESADTIGGTTQDLQCLGPTVRTLCNATEYPTPDGLHAAWEYSCFPAGSGFPDLNTRYNFRSYGASEWEWTDPDYMQSGTNVFDQRATFGSLASHPFMGFAFVSGHYTHRTGMAERKPPASSRQRIATVARGVLWLWPQSGDRPSCGGTVSVLLDITGRKVMDLRPGENDIRHIAPGVYFVRSAESGERSAASVRKVVIQR
jgi:hypothetical protein